MLLVDRGLCLCWVE